MTAYSWAANASGNPYLAGKTSVTDEGTANAVSTTVTQVTDQYGNVTQAVTPLRTYTSVYLDGAAYTSNYIRNRLLTTTMGGVPQPLVQNYYDGRVATAQGQAWTFPCGGGSFQLYPAQPAVAFNPNSPVPWNYRALVVGAVNPSGSTCIQYYDYGGVNSTRSSNGSTTYASADASTNYAAPLTVSTQSYSETIAYNPWLGVTQTTGLNGEQLSMSYDGAGRPAGGTSPFGAVTTYGYTYASGAVGATQTVTGPGGFTRSTLDGLGRVVKVEHGADVNNLQSVVDTVYTPCSCSPLGKVWKVSMPYPAGQSAAAWTVYSYDGIGRTLSTVQPDGASTTSYVTRGTAPR